MNQTRRRLLQALALLPFAMLGGRELLAQEPRLSRVPLILHGEAGPQRMTVEVARSLAERGRGLMEREQLAEDAGMLFLYDRIQPSRNGFWMYQTLIPLDIAFIDDTGRILEIHRMAPCDSASAQDCPVTRPSASYRAALEVNAGYFEARGIVPGDCVSWPGDGGLCVAVESDTSG
ncbi:DUF192 domain-containing protein [Halomonas organivorans]|uniref:DUF192 domain-containing protein n=1 Tax=Halomonas organivorans TaxID=257772 RepID=A0A7W5G5R5_9GAMM|nr:DUF192 domain-containing protein [Halomonas organivorans]MBB3141783.1 hypothetical protein [Halomonas organivorans]